jgi:hypothetical protein
MAATRKPKAAELEAEATVTVTVTPGLLVFHDGEQRGGELTGVPEAVARDWAARGWVEVAE